jgi:flavin reductase (DIM6/NTAB) family NADH-FMN oxidoreductase RutF
MPIDQCQFRAAMARLATGVTVLTTSGANTAGASPHEVMTANAVTSVSLEPMLLLASVGAGSRWLQAARDAGQFAVNVLGAGHEPVARWCADHNRHEHPETIEAWDTRVSDSGLLILNDALLAVECAIHSEAPAGDHVLLLGEVRSVHVHDKSSAPLIFFNRGFTTVSAPAHLHSVQDAVGDRSVYSPFPEEPAAAASR